VDTPAAEHVSATSLREIVMGAQDNLTNVLAVVLGVAVGSGRIATVALAGLAAGIAEAISMAGVLYTSTRAEYDLAMLDLRGADPLEARARRDELSRTKRPLKAAVVTFAAAVVAAAIPLLPFALLPLRAAMAVSVVLSVSALFALGGWKGSRTGRAWWRDGAQFVAIGGLAAVGASLVGALLKTNGV